MTKDEESLLLFFETCLVDHGGEVKTVHMNDADFAIAGRWHDRGYIAWGRMRGKWIVSQRAKAVTGPDLRTRSTAVTHWVRFSGEAWRDAARLRRERAERLMSRSEQRCGYVGVLPCQA